MLSKARARSLDYRPLLSNLIMLTPIIICITQKKGKIDEAIEAYKKALAIQALFEAARSLRTPNRLHRHRNNFRSK